MPFSPFSRFKIIRGDSSGLPLTQQGTVRHLTGYRRKHYRVPSLTQQGTAGLTLVELLVVLSIVAVLSTIAMRSVVGLLEEKHHDANISQLEAIEKAVLGDHNRAGFLSDIGRLPQAVGADPKMQLQELWVGSPNYNITEAPGDSEIKLGAGWRGPYLNLGLTRNTLTDGFANNFLFWQADGTLAGNGDPIAIIQSLGADNLVGGSTYNEDFEIVFQAGAGAVPAQADAETDRWRVDLEVIVVRDGGTIRVADGLNLIVRVYGADGAGGIHTVQEQKAVIAIDTPSQTFSFNDLPLGAKVLRAYQDATDPTDEETEIITTSSERKSPATHLVIDRFTGVQTLTLY